MDVADAEPMRSTETDAVRLYLFDLRHEDDDPLLLDADERARSAALSPGRRHEFSTARAVLKRTLAGTGDPADVRIRSDSRGKPCARSNGDRALPAFNLSHDHGRMALVTGVGALGVDLQHAQTPDAVGAPWRDGIALRRFAVRHLAPDLRDALLALPEAHGPLALLRLWVQWEAVSKAMGRGIAAPWPQLSSEHTEAALENPAGLVSRTLTYRVAGRDALVHVRLVRSPWPGSALAVARVDALGEVHVTDRSQAVHPQ